MKEPKRIGEILFTVIAGKGKCTEKYTGLDTLKIISLEYNNRLSRAFDRFIFYLQRFESIADYVAIYNEETKERFCFIQLKG